MLECHWYLSSDNMKQQQQQQKSLALELNKYLSHWKALGLFSKYVHQNAGSWGRRASGCCCCWLALFGFRVLQEAFLRARVSWFGFGVLVFFFLEERWWSLYAYCASGSIRCLCDCFQRSTSDTRGWVQRARPLPAATVPFWSFLALEIQPFPPFPFAKVIRARGAASPLPASASLGACSAMAGERGWTNPTFLEEDPP